MDDWVSITSAADELSRMSGQVVRPRQISTLLYDRELREDYCPRIGSRHVIAREYLPEIARIMRRKGWLRQLPQEDVFGG